MEIFKDIQAESEKIKNDTQVESTVGKSDQVEKKSGYKEYTEEELFQVALRYIESMANHGSSSVSADTKELSGQKGSFIEESIKKAHEMVANGEAERIARRGENKVGLETQKSYDEKSAQWN